MKILRLILQIFTVFFLRVCLFSMYAYVSLCCECNTYINRWFVVRFLSGIYRLCCGKKERIEPKTYNLFDGTSHVFRVFIFKMYRYNKCFCLKEKKNTKNNQIPLVYYICFKVVDVTNANGFCLEFALMWVTGCGTNVLGIHRYTYHISACICMCNYAKV